MLSHLLLIPNVESTPALVEALKSPAIAVPGADFAVIVRAVRIERQLPWEGNVADEVAKYTAESVADYLRASGIAISRSRAGAAISLMLEEEVRAERDFQSIVLVTSRRKRECADDLAAVIRGNLPVVKLQTSARGRGIASKAAVQWLAGYLELITDLDEVTTGPALQSIDFWEAVFLLVASTRQSGTLARARNLLLAQQLPAGATNARSSAALVALLMSADVRVRRLAVAALGSGPVTNERTAARRALQDSDVQVRIEALRVLAAPVLAREGVTKTTTTMANLLAMPIGERRARAGGRIEVAALSVLTSALNSRSTEARWLAAACLARSRDPSAVPALRLALQDESSAVSSAAADGLLALGLDIARAELLASD